jgi:hypothetical protein
MLQSETSIRGGGFLADEDHRTTAIEVLALFLVNHIMAHALMHVKWDKQQAHLPQEDIDSQTKDSQCPSEAEGKPKFPICCPCVRDGDSAYLVSSRRNGPTLILAPESRIRAWSTYIDANIDLQGLKKYFPEARNLKICILTKNKPLSRIDDETQRLITTRGSNGVASFGHSRFLVLTSPAAWDECVIDKYRNTFHKKVFNVPWGRVVRDQWERQTARNSKTAMILNSITGKPHLWAVSTTPFESSPANLSIYVEYLARNSDKTLWSGNRDLQWAIKLDLVDRHYKLLAKWGWPVFSVDLSRFIREFEHVLKGLTIRRTIGTLWFGETVGEPRVRVHEDRLVTCPVPKVAEVSITTLRKQAEYLRLKHAVSERQIWAKNGFPGLFPVTSVETWYSLARVFRMTATIPGLARLAVEKNMSLSTEEFESNEWWKETGKSPYEKSIQGLGDSKKLTELVKILSSIDHGRNIVDKAIVVSEFPVVAFVTYLVRGRKTLLFRCRTSS